MNDVYPADNYMSKVNNRNTRTRCEICSTLTLKIPERRQWRRSGVSIVNFEQVNAEWEEQFPRCSTVFIIDFEQVFAQ